MHEDDRIELALAQILEGQRRIVSQLEALPARVAAAMLGERQERRLDTTDLAALRAVLPLIFDAVGSATWQLRDLAADRPDVYEALLRAAGASGPSPDRKAGKLLARAAGVPVRGLLVERSGERRSGALWTLKEVLR